MLCYVMHCKTVVDLILQVIARKLL